MKFKLDENLPADLVPDFIAAGRDAETVEAEGMAGSCDPVLLDRARSEGRVLLTLDKGIGDVRTYPPEQYAGIVLLRLSGTGRSYVLSFVRRHLAELLEMERHGRLTVVSEAGIRAR